MKISIVGGTGFVGRNLASALVSRGHAVTALSRARPEGFVDAPNLKFRAANVGNAETLVSAFEGADVVVYSVGLLREDRAIGQTFQSVQLSGVDNVVKEAVAAGVQRLVLISANGVSEQGTGYQRTKYQAEKIVENSGLEYSIFRPSVIFGDSAGSQEFSWQLYRDIVRPPIPAPEFLARWLAPRKEVLMSPVAIDDVVIALVRQIEQPLGQQVVFELGGPESLGWREIIERIADATGRRKRFVTVPIKMMMLPAMLLGRFSFFPVTGDQLRMLADGNVADSRDLFTLTRRAPTKFSAENLEYLRRETT